MDLLAGYDSDATGEEEDKPDNTLQYSSLAHPHSTIPLSSVSHSVEVEQTACQSDAEPPAVASVLSKLPPPSKRKLVNRLQLFSKEKLAEIYKEEPEEKPAKKHRPAPAKSMLLDFLPPPTQQLSVPHTATSVPKAREGQLEALSPSLAVHAETAVCDQATTAPYGNELYRVDVAQQHQESYQHNGGQAWSYLQGHQNDALLTYKAEEEGNTGGHTSAETILLAALREEQEKAARRGQGGGSSSLVQFKEINAKELTYMDPGAKAAADSTRTALGADYAANLISSAKAFSGDKLARRKHQIGTLFYNAKMQELELLEKKGTSMKNKTETLSKYGWK